MFIHSRRTIFADCFLANMHGRRGLTLLQNSSWFFFVITEALAKTNYNSLNFSAAELASVITCSYLRRMISVDFFCNHLAEEVWFCSWTRHASIARIGTNISHGLTLQGRDLVMLYTHAFKPTALYFTPIDCPQRVSRKKRPWSAGNSHSFPQSCIIMC